MPKFLKLCLALFAVLILFNPAKSEAATLSVNPVAGTFNLDGTFSASIYLDTNGKTINLFDIFLQFPPDKLQVISPAVGKSIASIWTTPPTVDNANGVIHLQGGIPKGINTNSGLITSITFRVRRVGEAAVKFGEDSKVLLNDGKGTVSLTNTINAIYSLTLPPPAGPYVISKTHPDQTRWYSFEDVALSWPYDPDVSFYSYVLSSNPAEIPDEIPEGNKNSVGYSKVKSGTHYFHIRSKRGNFWGGTTHFAINIDKAPPAEFSIEVLPSTRTTSRNLVVNFLSTDKDSGMDHYEYKLVPLTNVAEAAQIVKESFFIEASSPIGLTSLRPGSYDLVVRAYDKTGNFSDERVRISIEQAIVRFVNGEGLRVGGVFTIPWPVIWAMGAVVLLLLMYTGLKFREWHRGIERRKSFDEMPEEIISMVDELKKYREKYGKVMMLLLAIGSMLTFMPSSARAEIASMPSPYVSIVSDDLTNNEVLYIGGKTARANETVIVYIQRLETGETFIERVNSDEKGDWFYSHGSFLFAGRYDLWVQSEFNNVKSPPSARFEVAVAKEAFQLGASRISEQTLYLSTIILFFLIAVILFAYNIFHYLQGRKKHKLFLGHVKNIEASVTRGFAVLKRDIEAEIGLFRKNKADGELSSEEKKKEAELLRDFNWIHELVGKEIWEMKSGEHEIGK